MLCAFVSSNLVGMKNLTLAIASPIVATMGRGDTPRFTFWLEPLKVLGRGDSKARLWLLSVLNHEYHACRSSNSGLLVCWAIGRAVAFLLAKPTWPLKDRDLRVRTHLGPARVRLATIRALPWR